MLSYKDFPKKSGIYCIENIENGKKYIGKSVNIYKRIMAHIQELKSGKDECSYLQNAWNKYGEDSFVGYIIELCEKEFLSDLEIKHIKHYKSKRPNGYNLTDGGDGNLGWSPSEETREKNRKAQTGKKHSEEAKRKVSEFNKGKVISEKTREKIGNAHRGKIVSDETKNLLSKIAKENMTDERRNTLSENSKRLWSERREDMIKALTGRIMPDSWKESLSKAFSGEKNPMYGKNHTEEAKKKQSLARGGKPSSTRGTKRKSTSSDFLGVYSKDGKWASLIIIVTTRNHLGTFATEKESAISYDLGATYFYKRDCNLNFPEQRENYISYLSQYDIKNIKELRQVIKNFINERS